MVGKQQYEYALKGCLLILRQHQLLRLMLTDFVQDFTNNTTINIRACMPKFIGLSLLFWILVFPLSAQGNKTKRLQSQLQEKIEQSAVFNKGFTGFALFDPAERAFLYTYQADKYFTPASNTKIFTFFAAETLLRSEWPVVHYRPQGDTLWLWGTGYPLLLHPDFSAYDTLGQWLAQRPEKTWLVANGHFYDERFGEGWSWDDYPYGYQVEKASLPIYGNAANFRKHGHLAPIKAQPAYFQDLMIYENPRTLSRYEDRNLFTFGDKALAAEKLDRSIAFRYTPKVVEVLLQDTFSRHVQVVADTLPRTFWRNTLSAPIPDTAYQKLLQDSDNFMAEQLLQMCSAQRYGHIHTERILRFLTDTVLANSPQPLDWVDGSGLSRYNKFTPFSIIAILDQLHQRVPQKRLFQLFPAGGVSGTIRKWYAKPEGEPYVFAKTGTLRHVHCLSGYLQTAQGKTYIFSFMHNNYPDKISELKEEMELVLRWLHEELE